MRDVLFVAGVLSIAACHRDAPPGAPQDAGTPRRADVAPPPPPDPCASVRQATDRIAQAFARQNPDGGAVRDTLASNHFGACARGASDVWAILPERIARVDGDLRIRWTLTHFDASGKPASIQPAIPDFEGCAVNASAWNFHESPGDSTVSIGEPTVFDYNGDGVTEVVVPITNAINEGPDIYNGRVWTAVEGAVALYDPTSAHRVFAVRDLDNDHRPDLIVHQPYYDSSEHCGSGFDYTVTGPEFALHSLPNGTFSNNDAVAIAFARTQCPSRPTNIIAMRTEQQPAVDDEQTARNVVCARLWGATEAELVAVINRTCTARPTEVCNTCEDPDLLRQWAAMDPPITLR